MIKKFKQFVASEYGWLPFLFSGLVIARVLGFNVGPVELVANVVFILLAVKLMASRIRFDNLLLCFLLYIPISLIIADPNPVFNSWMRYGFFVLLLLVVSPLLQNAKARYFRSRVFKASLFFCILIAAVSFVCYFLGINMMRNTYSGGELDYVQNTAGTFGGLTSQSMLLGPISGVALVACTYVALQSGKKVFWGLAVMCAGSLLFAASRSSLIATVLAEICLFYFSSKNKGLVLKRFLLVLLVSASTIPFWGGALEGITAKNKGSIESGVNLDSRGEKWSFRIEEWKSSPLFGIGFVAVSDRDNYTLDGGIEPGSSWLALLSMTGIFGFLFFVVLFFRGIKRSLLRQTPMGALVGSLLVLLGVHMFAEGHIFSGGSYLCFLVWLVLGSAIDYEPEKQVIKTI